jgi:hypothetical protein
LFCTPSSRGSCFKQLPRTAVGGHRPPLQPQDRDGYENWLTTLLLDQFGNESSPLIRVTFHDLSGQDVCRISVKRSPKAIYVTEGVGENLYIRTGNATRQLTTKEAIEYSKQRWK